MPGSRRQTEEAAEFVPPATPVTTPTVMTVTNSALWAK